MASSTRQRRKRTEWAAATLRAAVPGSGEVVMTAAELVERFSPGPVPGRSSGSRTLSEYLKHPERLPPGVNVEVAGTKSGTKSYRVSHSADAVGRSPAPLYATGKGRIAVGAGFTPHPPSAPPAVDVPSVLIVPAAHPGDGGEEMGVLPGGVSYLSQRSLAAFCGVDESSLRELSAAVTSGAVTPAASKVRANLNRNGWDRPGPYVLVKASGRVVNAYPDLCCLAFLRYYALSGSEPAADAMERLAGQKMREHVYAKCGMGVRRAVPKHENYHAMMALNKPPRGYFSILLQCRDLVYETEEEGLPFDEKSSIVLSAAGCFGRYWTSNKLDDKYGQRLKFEHWYPDRYPQSQANPLECWIYPVDSLPEFARWRDEVYEPEKMRNYLAKKERQGFLPAGSAKRIGDAVRRPGLPGA